MSYNARVDDILIHTKTPESQRIYRVTAVLVGGEGQDSAIELCPVGYIEAPTPAGLRAKARVPALMLEDAVDAGIVQCVWRQPDD